MGQGPANLPSHRSNRSDMAVLSAETLVRACSLALSLDRNVRDSSRSASSSFPCDLISFRSLHDDSYDWLHHVNMPLPLQGAGGVGPGNVATSEERQADYASC